MKIITSGELLERVKRNQERMQSGDYVSPQVFQHNGASDWPGDWAGRAILALCSLCHIVVPSEKEKLLRQLESIFRDIKKFTNEKNYFGDEYNQSKINEQQLSGNSWYIRGLCEYYNIIKSKELFDTIESIQNNFLIKMKGNYSNYPLQPREEGGVGGHLQNETAGNWMLSSDIGCAFIMLDGMTHAYSITKNKELLETIREAFKYYWKLDYKKVMCQTHATLTSCRAILRMYRLLGEKELLNKAISIFDDYYNFGMTINYSNFNWFGKPWWTEPCAVVDSFMVAKELFLITCESKYATICNRIYLNAVRTEQRRNGGAGCQTCLTQDKEIFKMYMYEANFCCSMRFSEGLRDFVEMQNLTLENDTYVIALPNSHKKQIDSGEISLTTSGDEEKGKYIIEVKSKKEIFINLYVPNSTQIKSDYNFCREGCFIKFCASNDKIVFNYTNPFYIETILGRKVHLIGDLFLTQKNVECYYKKYTIDGKEYSPIANSIFLDEPTEKELEQLL